jgi:glycosyltransferase involved in cell wall biosynthesis
VLDLCRELARDFEVHVLAPHARGASTGELMDGVHVHRFRYLPDAMETLAYDGGITDRLRGNPLRLLQVPFFLAAEFLAAMMLARTLRPAAIHAHWLLPQGLIAILIRACLVSRPPVVCTLHGTDVHGWNSGPLRWLKSRTLRRTDRVTAVSDTLGEAARRLGADPRWLTVAPMGVDTDGTFHPGPPGTRVPGTAVFVGRLVAGKGVDILLRAWERLPAGPDAAMLVIVGDGPARRSLERQVAKSGLNGRVRFCGALAPAKVADEFRRASVAVFPFTAAQGLGLAIAEAQACGCPVIGSGIPALARLIVPGVTGILTPPGDVAALTNALDRALKDPEMTAGMAANALENVTRSMTWKEVSNRYRAILSSLIQAS